jgi:hypothetical protein
LISLDSALKFASPKGPSRRRYRREWATLVSMPITTVNPDNRAVLREHYVRFARQRFYVFAEAQAGPVQQRPNEHLSFRVAPAYARHVEAALGGCVNVCQFNLRRGIAPLRHRRSARQGMAARHCQPGGIAGYDFRRSSNCQEMSAAGQLRGPSGFGIGAGPDG